MRTLFIILFCFVSILSRSQIIIKGQVINKKMTGMEKIMVALKPFKNANINAFSYTDNKGNYQLTYIGKADSLWICISGMNILPQGKYIKIENQSQDFITEERTIKLKEVVCKANKIWGKKDTINYLVSSFSNKGDFVIRDVLQKMPGIEVKESGKIYYNGKPISNFYIENLDLLQGRYGIATNNIQAKNISTVQVLENHQPIKALEDNHLSTGPAINLKLKEGAKGVWNIMAQVGIGTSPLLWENELNTMYFNKQKQQISTYKGNNTGVDLSDELTSFTGLNNIEDENLLQLRMPSIPNILKKRYIFNNSNAITTNNLFKISDNKQLNLNIVYLNDHSNKDSYSKSSYFIAENKSQTIIENTNIAQNSDRLETDITYNNNTNEYYMNNNFKVKMSWNNGIGSIDNTIQNIKQKLYTPQFNVSNIFQLVRKQKDGTSFNINSKNFFYSLPQTLTIYPGLYNDFFNVNEGYSYISQYAKKNTFQSVNSASIFSRMKNYLKISLDGGLEAQIQKLNSNIALMSSRNLTGNMDSLKNDINWMKYTLSLKPSLIYIRQKFNATLFMSTNYVYLQYENKTYKNNYNKIYFNPTFSLEYKPGYKSQFNLEYEFKSQIGSIEDVTSGYLLKDYRSMTYYNNSIIKKRDHLISMNWNYKDVLKMFFGSFDFLYIHTRNNMLSDQRYINTLSISSWQNTPNSGDIAIFNLRASKAFNFLSSTLSLKLSNEFNSGYQYIENSNYRFKSSTRIIELSGNAKLTTWFSSNFSTSVGTFNNYIESRHEYSEIKTISNKLHMDFFLSNNIFLKLDADHYYNNSIISGNKNKYFADSELDYKLKKMIIAVCWSNIFNADKYVTSFFSNANSFYYAYNIRPQSILLKVKFNIK